MGCLYDRFDVEAIKGKDITIGEHFPQVFISESDKIFCYTGMCLKEKAESNQSLFMQPYYLRGLHSTDKLVSKEILAFYRIIDGYITLDEYVDDGFYSNHLYKKIDCGIRFPSSDNYYAVFFDREADEQLTRGLFGLTHTELSDFLEAYGRVMGTFREYTQYPRLTRSPRNTNHCDITGVWIPEQFPYVAFNDSGYDFSHVALYGFYRYIQLLTGYSMTSVFSKSLLNQGADKNTLDRILKINLCNPFHVKILEDTLTKYKL